MDPRPRVEAERARREARERKLRLIQVALGRTPRDGPVGWAKRFEQQPPAADAERPGSLRDATPRDRRS